MRKLLPVFLIAITAWLLGLVLPWWSLAIPCLALGGWAAEKAGFAFLSGFVGIGGLWLVQASYIDFANGGILTARIADLFSLPHPTLVIAVTVVIGGLAGGISSMTGCLFKAAFLSKTN